MWPQQAINVLRSLTGAGEGGTRRRRGLDQRTAGAQTSANQELKWALIFGGSINVAGWRSRRGHLPFKIKEKAGARYSNRGAGHAIPTGIVDAVLPVGIPLGGGADDTAVGGRSPPAPAIGPRVDFPRIAVTSLATCHSCSPVENTGVWRVGEGILRIRCNHRMVQSRRAVVERSISAGLRRSSELTVEAARCVRLRTVGDIPFGR